MSAVTEWLSAVGELGGAAKRESRKTRLLMACAAYLTVCGPAAAQETGIGLYGDCIGPNKNEVTDLTCQSYFNGFSEGYFAVVRASAPSIGICLPEGVTPNQIRLVTEQYMRMHPEQLHLLASHIILDAMRGAFPCKASN